MGNKTIELTSDSEIYSEIFKVGDDYSQIVMNRINMTQIPTKSSHVTNDGINVKMNGTCYKLLITNSGGYP